MKTYLTLSAIALAAAATLSSGAMAQTAPAPDFTVTGNFGVTSDYRFRGISQSDRDPAIQGGFDVAHKSGLYVGTWASTVSDWAAGPGSQNLEVDLYGGYKTEVSGVALDVGAITYRYPGSTKTSDASAPNWRANTSEAYVGLTYGPVAFKTSYVLSKNYFASSGTDNSGTLYYDLTISQEIAPKLVASIHAGYTDYKDDAYYIRNNGGKFSYADYNIGLAYDIGNGFTLSGKYYMNDMKAGSKAYANASAANGKPNLYKDGVAVSLTKAF